MKKASMLAAAAMLFGAGSASAQDWSGFYVGGNLSSNSGESLQNATVSGTWTSESQALRDFVNSHYDGDLEPEGMGYGVQAGYNWQMSGGFVLGAELGYSLYDVDDGGAARAGTPAAFPALTYTVTNTTEIESAWNARANVGYDFGPVLGYAVLGYTWADTNSAVSIVSNGNYRKAASVSDQVGGFTWGLGGAMRLGGPWSARLEYTQTEFDDTTFTTAYVAGSSFAPPGANYIETYTQDLSTDAIQLGVNFHF